MDNTKELTHISLCTGYGGIDLGLKRAIGAIRTVCYVEIESFVIKNLVAKVEKGLLDLAPIFTNLKEFPWESFSGRVDILSGGFPCQPFSFAGNRAGDEDPRHLWPYIVAGIRRLGRPPIIFLENVEGILSTKLKGDHWTDPENTPVLLHVHRELERLGYKATSGIFSASEVGAPHQRKRVFIFGVRDDLGQSGIDYVNRIINEGRVGNTEGKQDGIREQRKMGNKVQEIWEKVVNTVGASSRNRGVAYPAGRGREQYWYEPPRVTVGYTEHDGLPNSKKRRNSDETGYRREEGQNSTIESEGASQPRSDGSLQTSELGRSELSILSTLSADRETGGFERANRSTELQRETESSLGGNVDGSTDWLDYAELYESCDDRTDELRMLGNGVVPDTASRAFVTLWNELVNMEK